MAGENNTQIQHELDVPLGVETLVGSVVTKAEFCVYSEDAAHQDQIPFGD
jgi:hypothetical protein